MRLATAAFFASVTLFIASFKSLGRILSRICQWSRWNVAPHEYDEGISDGLRQVLPPINHERQPRVPLDNVVG
jgi:hypothetical protein